MPRVVEADLLGYESGLYLLRFQNLGEEVYQVFGAVEELRRLNDSNDVDGVQGALAILLFLEHYCLPYQDALVDGDAELRVLDTAREAIDKDLLPVLGVDIFLIEVPD